ncbi:MAG: hypothetical protein QHH07_05055 [Sedimentisphaerales bacterium]|nr:hypothetical protein [Sedimentisphaerales bacterium]
MEITDQGFCDLLNERAGRLLGISRMLTGCAPQQLLTRPLLGELHAQAQQVEELLDAYDARNNCRWCRFRALTAALKIFSAAGYELIHIKHALPAYRLLPIGQDFLGSTDKTLIFIAKVLIKAAGQLVGQAQALGLTVDGLDQPKQLLSEQLPPGRLARNCKAERTNTIGEVVTLLATAFLNLAYESKDVCAAGHASPEQYADYLQGAVKEERLRGLELRFHNLQSQYDTYVAGTQCERQDQDLLVLRGHISVVFHLFVAATLFAHYYERHASNQRPCTIVACQEPVVDPGQLVGLLMSYFMGFIGLYIHAAEDLCRSMLRRYIVIDTIELPVPRYRGFHVRPATLISRLVLRYGSEVKMYLDDEAYDASQPLELFRANEKLNAVKRRMLSRFVLESGLLEQANSQDFREVVQKVISRLVEQGKVVVYERPLPISPCPPGRESTLDAQVVCELNRLLGLGKIDVDFPFTVKFVGDKRVLQDLALLASCGYGEDQNGNNIPLPEQLRSLRN